MFINVRKFKFDLKRKKNLSLSESDLNFLNDLTACKIVEKPVDYYIERLKNIKLDKNRNLVDEAVNKLNSDGVFVIENFLNETDVTTLANTIELETNKYLMLLNESPYFEDRCGLIQRNSHLVKGYPALSSHPKTVFDVRSGFFDLGMIDIFNIDKLFGDPVLISIFDSIRKDAFLIKFIKALPNKTLMKNINAYSNSGVTSTRGFHVDTYTRKLKIFIYLTDVFEFSQGPYTYVRGSHVDSTFRRINQIFSQNYIHSTETPFVPDDEIYPIFAPKGSLVLSDQSGFHRGFPQSNNGRRRLLSINLS